MTELVDWQLAIRLGARWAPSGPDMPVSDARSLVRQLRGLAAEAVSPVADVTGMHAPVEDAVEIVDRRTWIASNVTGLRVASQRLVDESATNPFQGIGRQASAAQVGGALAWLSGKVLGQYEVFTDPGSPRRLLLVAPTIVAVQRQLDVPERDFQLWVCLHEETHRVQFGAVPWLADYLLSQVQAFMDVSDVGFADVLQRVSAIARTGKDLVRGRDVSILEALQSPAQREIFTHLTALMSLLEGHADVVMDEVGPNIIPSVDLIRQRFTARRTQPKPTEAFMRKAIGMDAKLRQYSQGAAFVRAIVAERGMAGFNVVWASPENLPTKAEIDDPAIWLARIP
jgi:coenzyme F420 biosynthesis associated uncharacterized protein